jgi:hypothetical protein
VGLRSVPQDFKRHFGSRCLQNRTNNSSYQTALHITLSYSLTPFFTQILRRNCKSHADMAGVVRKASVLCNPSRETGCSNIHAHFSCTFIRFSHENIKKRSVAKTRLSSLFQSHFNMVTISPSKRNIEIFDITQNHPEFVFRFIKLCKMAYI